jgi:hypothetical protein
MLTSPLEGCASCSCFRAAAEPHAALQHRADPGCADRAPDPRRGWARADHGALGPGAVLGRRSLDRQSHDQRTLRDRAQRAGVPRSLQPAALPGAGRRPLRVAEAGQTTSAVPDPAKRPGAGSPSPVCGSAGKTVPTVSSCAIITCPAKHWDHLRTSNPIESVFATVRHRTVRTKGSPSHKTAQLMVFKLVMSAAKTWRRLKGENQFANGHPRCQIHTRCRRFGDTS